MSVRVVVADDSPTARSLLTAILGADPDIEVVAEVPDGEAAVAAVLKLRPSIVVMDIEMPRVDGFEATRRIMDERPTPIVIVTSKHDPRDVAVSLRAMEMGALTVLPKPVGPTAPAFSRETQQLASLVKALAEVKVVRRRRRASEPAAPGPPEGVVARTRRGPDSPPVRVIGVAASTGGPPALFQFLRALPSPLPVPVLVVQHIAPGFVDGLVRWLGSGTRLPVDLARAGGVAGAGQVYVAPDGRHLEVRPRGLLVLSDDPPVGGFKPSANALFRSLAQSYGESAAAVVLTGMGSDGAEGARIVKERGGVVLAQDQATSTVFGMPKVVTEAGLADVIGPVDALARAVAGMVEGGSS